MKRILLLCGVVVLAVAGRADMGSIAFNSVARVFEPNQRALIACNGREQILILSTDLQADRETKVLEVMPFPSEPAISESSVEVFTRATKLINSKLPRIRVKNSLSEFITMGASDHYEPPAGRVTFHERIGAHDISTIHVERPEGFIRWVEDYLRAQGVENPVIPPELAKVIGDYISDNFRWFVFDVVSLTDKLVSKEAIQFRFKTDFLFYPTRITRAEEGYTEIRLLVLSPRVFETRHFLGLSQDDVRMLHEPVTLTSDEVAGISKDIASLFGDPGTVQIRTWLLRGRLDSFEDDVIVGDASMFIQHLRRRNTAESGPELPAPVGQ